MYEMGQKKKVKLIPKKESKFNALKYLREK